MEQYFKSQGDQKADLLVACPDLLRSSSNIQLVTQDRANPKSSWHIGIGSHSNLCWFRLTKNLFFTVGCCSWEKLKAGAFVLD